MERDNLISTYIIIVSVNCVSEEVNRSQKGLTWTFLRLCHTLDHDYALNSLYTVKKNEKFFASKHLLESCTWLLAQNTIKS